MVLEIHHISEEDLAEWSLIRYLAFTNSPSSRCFWHRQPSELSLQTLAKARRPLLKDPNDHLLKCIDTSIDSKMIAIAHWTIHPHERMLEDLGADYEPFRAVVPEQNEAAVAPFVDLLYQSRREFIGTKPHLLLEIVATHPEYHRRGAGGALVKWGCDKADELGVDVHLEAHPAGIGLYEKFGFVRLKEMEFDMGKYGHGLGSLRTIVSENENLQAFHAELFGFLFHIRRWCERHSNRLTMGRVG
jgi:GNAT superfamily N-acetyltransferase